MGGVDIHNEKLPCLICSSSEVKDATLSNIDAQIEKNIFVGLSIEGLQNHEKKSHKSDKESLEAVCKYLQLNVSVPENINGNVQLFCFNCDQLISELVNLHKQVGAIEEEICRKIQEIDNFPSCNNKKRDAFINQFREQVCKRTSKRKSEDEQLPAKGSSYHHVVEIEPKLMHQNIIEDVVIKVQPNDDPEDYFSSGEINPFFDENSDFEDPTQGEKTKEEIENDSLMSPVGRRLRPRRSQYQYQQEIESDYAPKGSKVKTEPESDDNDEEMEDANYVDNDSPQEDDEDGDDPDVSFSQDESAEEGSDSEDEEWSMNPSKKPKLETKRRTPSTSSSGRKKRVRGSGLGRGRPRTRDKSDRNNMEDKDLVVSSDGKLYYQDIEIIKTDENFRLFLKCGECAKEIEVTPSQLQAKKESIYYKMKVHIRGVHLGEYSCPICSKTLSNGKTLKRHIARHCADRPIADCPICAKPFKTVKKEFLSNHMWSHKSEEEKQEAIAAGEKPPMTYAKKIELAKIKRSDDLYQCTECDKSFLWKSLLQKHINRNHIPEDQKIKNFKCTICGKMFATQGDLTSHKRFVCEKEKLARLYFCSFCEKNFTTKDDLTKHERKHTKDKPFVCTKCNKCYSQEKTLKVHMKDCTGVSGLSGGHTYHGVEITQENTETGFILKCGCCEYTVSHERKGMPRHETFRKIHVHIKGRHLGAYRCNICGKQLSEPKSLRNHVNAHSAGREPSHHCDICGKPFKTKHNRKFLLTHQWSHMSEAERQEKIDAGEKPPISYAERVQLVKAKGDNLFQCDQCGKTFAWQCQLKKHERAHSSERNFQCPTCGKFYATQDGLNSHTKHVHDKDKVHKWHYCTFCEKKFSHKYAWRKHERSHKRDSLKPFKCSTCAKSFSQEKNFQAHLAKCQEKQQESNSPSDSMEVENNNSGNSRVLSVSDCDDQSSGGIHLMIPPAHSSGHSNSLLHQQFRNQLAHPPVAGSSAAAAALLSSGHHFLTGGPGQVPPGTRFYEDGSVFPNFY